MGLFAPQHDHTHEVGVKKISYLLVLLTLCFTPLAFGTVEPWSITLMEVLLFCAVICYFFPFGQTESDCFKVPGIWPLGLFLGWMVLQLIPFPESFIHLVSPGSWNMYDPVLSLSKQTHWIPLTVDRKATTLEVIRIASYCFLYILTIQQLSNGERLQKTVKWIGLLAIFIAGFAIVLKFTSPDKMYWLREIPVNGKPFGPWINRSQYSGFMTMIGPMVLALYFSFRPSIRYKEGFYQRLTSFFTMPGSNQHLIYGGGALLIFATVLLSLSRGGVMTLCVSLLLFFALLAKRKRQLSMLPILLVTVCCSGVVLWFGWQPLVERFGKIIGDSGELNIQRLVIWQDSLRMLLDFPITGSGFGTFGAIYPLYKTTVGNLAVDHAHNDFIELLTNGGPVAFILAGWFILAVLGNSWKIYRKRKDNFSIFLTTGCLTGVLAALIYGLTDFNFHNGADGLYFFFLCGLLVSVANTRLHYRTKPTCLDYGSDSAFPALIICVGALVFLCMALVVQGGGMLAQSRYAKVETVYLNKFLKQEKLESVAKATLFAQKVDPLESRYPAKLGDIERYRNNPKKSLDYYRQAAEKEPVNSFYLQQIGQLLSATDKPLAGRFMQESHARALNKDAYVLSWVEWLLWNNERQKAIQALKKGIQRNTSLAVVSHPLLAGYSFTREEVEVVLPASTDIWVQYGLFLEGQGDTKEAEYFLDRSLGFLEQTLTMNPNVLHGLYFFYRKQGLKEKSVEVLRQGKERYPGHAFFHIQLGDSYMEKGIFYRARDEYEQALLLKPDNENILRRIGKLPSSP